MVAREHVLGLVGEIMNMAAARHSDDDFLDVNALVRTTSAKFRPPNRGNSMQLYKYLIQINHHKFVSLSQMMICTIDVKAQVHASDIEMTFVFFIYGCLFLSPSFVTRYLGKCAKGRNKHAHVL